MAEFTKEQAAVAYRAHRYARDVIKGRFPEGEAAIDEDPETAADYTTFLESKYLDRRG